MDFEGLAQVGHQLGFSTVKTSVCGNICEWTREGEYVRLTNDSSSKRAAVEVYKTTRYSRQPKTEWYVAPGPQRQVAYEEVLQTIKNP